MQIILLLALVPVISAGTRRFIINQQDLASCNGHCNDMPWKYNTKYCKKIYNCQFNTKGWDSGLVRCDYCNCACDTNDNREKHETVTQMTFDEKKLYGDCKLTCLHKGLVRSETKHCNEIRNCEWHKNGWTWWFWRCDYCMCQCVKWSYASKYTLTNMKYDMSATANEEQGTILTIGQTVLENHQNIANMASRTITFTKEKTESITTSVAVEAGISVTVEASSGVDSNSVSTAVATSLTTTTSFEKGTSTTETFADSFTAIYKVPPKSSVRAVITAHKFKVSIPYTATMVTTWGNGEKTSKAVSGVYTNVSVGKMRAVYEAPTKL